MLHICLKWFVVFFNIIFRNNVKIIGKKENYTSITTVTLLDPLPIKINSPYQGELQLHS